MTNVLVLNYTFDFGVDNVFFEIISIYGDKKVIHHYISKIIYESRYYICKYIFILYIFVYIYSIYMYIMRFIHLCMLTLMKAQRDI